MARPAVDVVLGLVERLVRRNGASSLLGVGIGAPGLIDSRTGVVRWSVSLDWEDLPLGEIVGQRFGMPAVVANDSQAAALAEATFSDHGWPANLIVVRVGRGVGAGIILNGRLFQGDGSGAGEIGHSIFGDADSMTRREECRCGRVGCLETVASMPAIIRAAQRRVPSVVDRASLLAAYRAGSEDVRDVVVKAGAALGQGIAAMISTLNVNNVLLIGEAIELGDEWLDAVRRQVTHQHAAARSPATPASSSAEHARTTS